MNARSRVRSLVVACFAAVCLGCPATRETPAHESSQQGAVHTAALQRWESFEPERRRELEARFEDLRELPPADRAALEQKKQALDAEIEKLHAHLSEDERAQLAQLAPHERRAVLRDLLLAAKRERGLLRRAHVPPHVLHELEGAPPPERRRMFDDWRRRAQDEGPSLGLRKLGERLGYAPAEIERVQRLEPRLRMETLQSWRRHALVRDIERMGLPPFLDAETWSELGALDDAAFWREMERLRPRDPWRSEGRAKGRTEGRPEARPEGRTEARPEARSDERPESRHPGARFAPRAPGEGPPRHGPPPPRGGVGPGPGPGTSELPRPEFRPGAEGPDDARDGAAARDNDAPALDGALRPTLQDLIELRHLPPEQRRIAIGKRIRGRVLQRLEARALISPEQLRDLRALEGERFFDRLRELLRESQRAR
jgi:hypothetical protein